MNAREEFLSDLAELARDLIPEIADDYRVSDDKECDAPGMQVTIGADESGWSYQTGDNSYTGGAYGYRCWGVGYLYRDTDPEDFARAILEDLESVADSDEKFFFDSAEDSQ